MNFDQLKTGDILLFTKSTEGFNWFAPIDWIIEWWCDSPFVHCAIVLRDPEFIHPSLKGIFIWESGWEFGMKDPQDDKAKLGVQITPLAEYLHNTPGCQVYVRQKKSDKDISSLQLSKIHHAVYNKPYDTDLIDWIRAGFNTNRTTGKPTTDRFWCSAFVAYVLRELGFVKKDVNWSVVRPVDFMGNLLLSEPECYGAPQAL